MKAEKDKARANLIRKLKENTAFMNQYDNLHIIDDAGSAICLGSVISSSNDLLDEALKSGGFIC